MLYNQITSNNGNNMPLPLLMNFTIPTKIQEAEEPKMIYDPISQISYSAMPTVGTYSLKSSSTKQGSNGATKSDKKNAIDDQKYKK